MKGRIYELPYICLFYKPYTPILLDRLRNYYIDEYNRKINKKRMIDQYIKENTPMRVIFEWSSYTSSSSSTTSSSSEDSSWVDLKKML